MNQMKILHINSYFSTSGLFKHLYDRQQNAGLDIDVYVPISHQYPKERIAASGEYTIIHRNHHQLERYLFHLKHFNILRDLKKTYQAEQYDLIHAHSLFSNGWLAYQLWKETKTPYVVAVRSADIRTFFDKMPWLKPMGLRILKNASQVFFISRNNYNEVFAKHIPASMKDALRAKTQVISNGIDPFWLNHRFTEKAYAIHHPLQIVSAGKTIHEKRFVQLAEMVKSYNDNIAPAHLNIVGPAWNPKIVEQLETFDCVTYHGPMNKEQLKEYYRTMDIFALLSSPETFGLVYPEAMSQGLPVIYTENEGFDSFFDNHYIGVSVAKTDELGFTKALDFIKQNYASLSNNALNNATKFNWDEVNQEYLNIYQEIIKK